MRGGNRHVFHEFVETAHMISGHMRRLRRFVPPALGYPDKARNAGVFGKTVLHATVQSLNMRRMQNNALFIQRKILWLNLHEALNYNHISGLIDCPLPLGKYISNRHP